MAFIDGDDPINGSLFSFQEWERMKNNWRGAAVPANFQPGMIFSDSDNDRLYHQGAAALDEIIQSARLKETAQAILATIPAINAKVVATTTLITVPAGKTMIVTQIVIRVTAFIAGAKAIQAIANFGSNAAAYDNYILARTYTVAAQDVMAREAAGAFSSFVPTHPAAAVFKINITTGSDATTETWEISVFGFLI